MKSNGKSLFNFVCLNISPAKNPLKQLANILLILI